MTAEAGKFQAMKITIEFDSSESHDVGAVIVALAASDVKYEAVFKMVEGVTGEADAELPTEMIQEQDYWQVQQVTLDDVIARALNYPPTVEDEEDPDEWGPENL